jgi:copper resistance protein D
MLGAGDIAVGIVLKLALYASALGASGLGLAVAINVLEQESRTAWIKSATGLAFIALAIAAMRVVDAALELGDLSFVAMVWDMQGKSGLAILGSGVMLLLATFSSGNYRRSFAGIGAISMSGAFALTGHTMALDTPSFWPLVSAIHVLIAGFWVAAPLILWPRKAISDANLAARTENYGRFALVLVPILFVGGMALALELGGGVTGLLRTSYGITLSAKLMAALGALALGAFNKLKIHTAFAQNSAQARRLLALTLGLDVVLFSAAIVAIALATTVFGPQT